MKRTKKQATNQRRQTFTENGITYVHHMPLTAKQRQEQARQHAAEMKQYAERNAAKRSDIGYHYALIACARALADMLAYEYDAPLFRQCEELAVAVKDELNSHVCGNLAEQLSAVIPGCLNIVEGRDFRQTVADKKGERE